MDQNLEQPFLRQKSWWQKILCKHHRTLLVGLPLLDCIAGGSRCRGMPTLLPLELQVGTSWHCLSSHVTVYTTHTVIH